MPAALGRPRMNDGGPVTVAIVFVSDLRHYLDLSDDVPMPAQRMAAQLGRIVRGASAHPVGTDGVSAVGCTRRPNRRPCDGFMMVSRRRNGEIAWGCSACGDEGLISGWENSPFDLSDLDDSYAAGEPVVLLVARDLFKVLSEVVLWDAASELLIAGAEGCGDGVLLSGRADAFVELFESVVAESNAETNRRRQRLLDQVCEVLEVALSEG